MKFTRYISLLLAITFVVGIILIPKNIKAGTTDNKTTFNSEPVLAKESDFNVRLSPSSNPSRAIISRYNGTDTKIIIPETIKGYPVKNIATSAFARSENLQYVKIPKSIELISSGAFSNNSMLTEIDVDPLNENLTSLHGVLYSKDMTSILAYPAGLKGGFTVPESVITIGRKAFHKCFNLTNLTMYNNVEAIYEDAFSFCWSLESVRLSDNLKVIGDRAFANCDSLTSIHLPGTLETIGQNAFLGGIDSDNNMFYYFNKGIFYVPGTPSETYVKSLALPKNVMHEEPRSITDINTGISIVDAYAVLPKGKLSFKAEPLNEEDIKGLSPVRYSSIYGFDLSLTMDGKPVELTDNVIVKINSVPPSASKTAIKLYRLDGNNARELVRTPTADFVGGKTRLLGKFIMITNNDFSLKGDVDGDGIITTYDVSIALTAAAEIKVPLTQAQKTAADYDKNGAISTNDARLILRKAAGIIK